MLGIPRRSINGVLPVCWRRFTSVHVSSIDELGEVPKISRLVDEIASLSLLESSLLAKSLKLKLDLPDVMTTHPVTIQQNATSSTIVGDMGDSQLKTAEKTEFRVILQKVDPAVKAKIIREIKSIMPGMNLVEAKAFVESVPKPVKEKLKKEEAEMLKKTLEDLGAQCLVE